MPAWVGIGGAVIVFGFPVAAFTLWVARRAGIFS